MKYPLVMLPPLALALVHCAALPAAPQDRAPAHTAGSGAFATTRYRKLFLEAGHSNQEISRKIDAAFQQLFHGDPETQRVFYPAVLNANGPLAYLTDIN